VPTWSRCSATSRRGGTPTCGCALVFEPPRAQVAELLERAVARGQLPRSLDRGLALALLLGPMMYCHALKRMQVEAPEDLPERVVAAFWKAHATDAAPAKPRRR
jgi:hypothetical protein